MVRDVSSWFVMFHGGVVVVVCHGSSWFVMFRGGSSWFVMVRDGS